MHSVQTLRLLSLAGLAPFFSQAQTTIPAGAGAYSANTVDETYLVQAGDTRSIASGGGVVVTLGGSAAGAYSLVVDGTVAHGGTNRAIRGAAANGVFNVTVGAAGVVSAVADDAIQARDGVFNVTNSGTIYSGPNLAATPTTAIATGQALDLSDAVGGAVVNHATGLIRADGHDAVRLGSNMTMTNHGVVHAATVVNDSPANNAFNTPAGSTTETFSAGEGVSFENGANSSFDNHGSIFGARHGVEADVDATNITITNRAAGVIVGRNGSGIGFDTADASASNVVIHNHGLVRGEYAGAGNVVDRTGSASPTHDGDGDGIDIDGAATIHNHAAGQIISAGAGGFDSDGRANSGEAIAIGGGVIVNEGVVRGADRGIIVNNDSVASRSGSSATSITNHAGAVIEGLNGYAIRLENKHGDARDNDTIVNAGTIVGNGSVPDPDAIVLRQNGVADPHSVGTLDGVAYAGTGAARFIRGDGSAIQTGEGADTLTNTGVITGNNGRAINMEGGDDTVNYDAGAITGAIDGGAGSDTFNLGAGVDASSAIRNFETVGVASGEATISGVLSGDTLTKTGVGTLVLTGANDYAGGMIVAEGALSVNNLAGSATGTGDVRIDAGAMLVGDGFIAGDVVLDGVLAPGNGIGTLTVGGDVTWNGSLAEAFVFELGAELAADLLVVDGDFFRGSGDDFVFDFAGTGANGTFVLVRWDGITTFAEEDFSYANLGGGREGAFSIVGNELRFTAVPEPSSAAGLSGLGALGLAALRRRRRAA